MIKPVPLINSLKSVNEERLELIINATGVGTWDWQVQTAELTFNERWAEIIGYTVAELSPFKFDNWADNFHPDDLPGVQERLDKHWRGELDLYEAEVRMRHKKGHYVWILVSGRVVEWHANGNPKRMLGTHLDITERKERESERIIANQLLQESQQVAKVGGWELNLETGLLYWTAETYRIHEANPDEFDPTVDAGIDYFLPESREILALALDQAINKGIGYDLELETLTTQGRKIDVRTTCNVTKKGDKSIRLAGIFQDISEQKSIQRKLEHSNAKLEEANSALQLSAHYDPLTGLPNRILLSDRMQQAMTKSVRRNQLVAIAFIDLDGFKVLNDGYGHDVGDQFLQQIAQQLKLSLREGDTLAHIGGDEFVAVIEELNEIKDSHTILSRLLDAATKELIVNGTLLRVSASIGVTFYPQNNDSPDQLLRQADQAMYKAKQLGKNRWHIFDVEQDVAIKNRHEELERLRLALKNEEFILFYQPKIDLRSKEVIGMEALIRWQHPEKGILPPAAFLPVLEQDALSIELGEWVIKSALEQLEIWRSMALEIPISVNISPLQLQHADFVSRLETVLTGFPVLNAHSLEFEILESSALQDINLVSGVIGECNQLGVTFSIDDFGTGYSSLTYLKRLPTEYLKIDQSFVRDMLIDVDDRTIIQGIIELAKAFDLKVIAEGVETPAHGEELLALGCFLAQGYGIAKPMPARAVPAWLMGWKNNPTLVDGTL
ncbi:MAG: diguanylate cyclase (GGDEF)-like protein/PAS domain S-box-containing protein [Oleispira sp.]